MDRRSFLASGCGTIVAGFAGCLGAGAESSGEHDVGMTMSSFRPAKITVEPGTEVEFRNTSSHTHTVTAFQDSYPDEATYFASGGFENEDAAVAAWNDNTGGGLEPDESFFHTFEIPGTYGYYCIPHVNAGMSGTVVVTEDA